MTRKSTKSSNLFYRKIMKITHLISVFVLTSVMQASALAIAQNITVNKKNSTLFAVLKEIRKQSGYDFYYEQNDLVLQSKISVNVNDQPIEQVLHGILDKLDLTYEVNNKIFTIRKKNVQRSSNFTAQQGIEVWGKVTNTGNTALPGATITIKGTSTSTKTDQNGLFHFQKVNPNSSLIITYLGHKTEEIRVKENLSVQLQMENAALEEVVIVNTGYQSISKERSTGSFSKPDMSVLSNRTGSMNVLQRLDGLIPGLAVNNAPNAAQNPLLIRGLTTIGLPNSSRVYSGTNRNPLYVVDGIPVDDVSSINPQDVDNITVLKDATAASIWGARASNGVIVITTKKGANNSSVSIQYDGFFNFQGKPNLDYTPSLDSKQFIAAAKEVFDPIAYPWATVSAYGNLSGSGVAPHERILYNLNRGLISQEQANSSLDSLASLDNRQQIKDLWYRNASLMNHTVSAATGSENYSFYGSAAYTDTRNSSPDEKNKSYKINLNNNFNAGKKIKINLVNDLTNTNTRTPRNINIDYNYYPYQMFKDASGNHLDMSYMQYLTDETRVDYENRSRINLGYVPLDERLYGNTAANTFTSRNVLGLNVKVIEGLQFEGTYGYVKRNSKTESYDDEKSYRVRSELVQFTVAPDINSTPIYYLPTTGGVYDVDNVNQDNWTVRNQFSYNRDWSDDKHQLTALLGQEMQENQIKMTGSLVRGYNDLLQTYAPVDYSTLGLSGVNNPVMSNYLSGRSILYKDFFDQSFSQTRFLSYYSNLAYTYARKYSLNASFRIDQSNLFGIDKAAQNKPVWSIGGKWNISREEFMSNVHWLDNLALRTTYGLTGNAPSPGVAASYDILTSSSSPSFLNGTGLSINTPSNAKLTWESTKNTNIGLDFAFLNQRISGSIDVYRKNTENLLGYMPTNSFSGYSSIVGNIGNLDNKGIELSLQATPVNGNNFSWNTILNLAYNKNKLKQLNFSTAISTAAAKIFDQYAEGYPAFAVFAYQYAGLDELGDPQIQLHDGTITKAPSAAKVEDVIFKGSMQPVWTGGFSNIFSYKSLSLAANTVFNLGHVMRRDVNSYYAGRLTHTNATVAYTGSGFTGGNVHSDFLDRWKQPGDELITDIPSYVSNSSTSAARRNVGYYTYGDINVISASYIKLRDITLSYRLPKTMLQNLKINDIALRLQVSNLLLWTANNEGIDPEYHNAYSGIRSIPTNQGSIALGANIKF